MPPGADDLDDQEISVESGRAEVSLTGDATFTGQILLRSGERLLRADGATFDRQTGTLQVTGDAEFRNEELRVSGSDARFSEGDGEVRFNEADFDIWTVPARGTAERLVVRQEGKVKMRQVTYTACPPGNNDWLLRASKVTLDQESGVGTAKDARFEIKGVPVFWLPTISYPITDKRKSGFLIPDAGNSERRGFDVATPWYWNIAPNYDATITPRLMTERGPALGVARHGSRDRCIRLQLLRGFFQWPGQHQPGQPGPVCGPGVL
jgi:LPS-assembly protein